MNGIYRSQRGAAAVAQRYRQVLDGWPVPVERRTVPTRYGETFVLVSGPESAPPVVALQGSGATSAMWRPRVAAWSCDLRVHAVDVIGEPGLSAPTRAPITAHADWLADVLDGLELPGAAFVGVSLGGRHATGLAVRRPERVRRLALISPSGIGPRRIGVLLAAVALRPFGEWGRRRTLAAVAGGATRLDPELGDLAMLTFRHFRPRTDAIPIFSDADLARLTMPVLAVLGGRDVMLDQNATARRLREHVPTGDVLLDPEAGHFVDAPEQVHAFLRGGS